MANIENISITIGKATTVVIFICGGLITGLSSYYGSKSAWENKLAELSKKQEIIEEKYNSLSMQVEDNKNSTLLITNRFNEYIRPDEIKPKTYSR